jgi:hypothetical protein
MPSIYDINFNTQSERLLPPDKRLPKNKAYLKALVVAIQTIRDWFFNYYVDGFSGDAWDNSLAYNPGDQVRYVDKGVYECIEVSGIGVVPTNTTFWVKIQDNYIGLKERLKYNSRKKLLEYILNKWFDAPLFPAPQIYIQNNNIFGSGFLLGGSGGTSSTMARSSANQQYFLGNTPSFSTYAFTIFVPDAMFTALDPSATNAENMIRSVADKYVIAGMLYDVQTYI